LYTGTLAGAQGEAAVVDGRPRYVPPLPEEQGFPGALGCRVAGASWLLSAFILYIIAQTQELGDLWVPVVAPMALIALILLIGMRFSAVLGMFAAVAAGLAFGFVGVSL